MAPTLGGVGEGVDRHVDQLTRKAIHAVAGHGGKGRRHLAARLPLREEAGHHGIAHGKLRHARAHGGDDTGAIGHGDAAIGSARAAQHHGQVMKVERAGVHAHLDLARLRRARCGQVDEAQLVKAAGVLELDGFHSRLSRREAVQPASCAQRVECARTNIFVG